LIQVSDGASSTIQEGAALYRHQTQLESHDDALLPRITALALIAAAGIAASQPVLAQDATSGEKVNQLIIYGDDPCPASNAGEITVCARKDESERFRIPAPCATIPTLRPTRAGPSGSGPMKRWARPA
jgi:hypothetical protein